MSINISDSNFNGNTQVGYTNISGSQIGQLENTASREGLDEATQKELRDLLNQLKEKMNRSADKSEVSAVWKKIEAVVSSSVTLAASFVQIGKALGL